jgi:nitrate reductase cytochrome c-type subunit
MKKTLYIVVALLLAVGMIAFVEFVGKDRADNRAFYTAPPTIPHELDEQNEDSCLDCHEDGMMVSESQYAPATPHPEFSACLQCHPTQVANFGSDDGSLVNSFEGLAEPTEDLSGKKGAPMMPHRLFLREKCLSCHSGDHPDENMAAPHPKRKNCIKCHKVNDEIQF